MEKKIKIFIAEDDVFISEQLKEILLVLGYNVTGIGHNTESSIRLLQLSPPDLAILDIKMHGKDDGFAIAAYINSNFDIPYIFLTSFSDKTTVNSAMGLNPAAYLVKPFSDKDIFSTLEVVKNNFPAKPKKILIRDGHTTIKIAVADILWVKSDDKYVEIQLSAKKHVQRGSITTFLRDQKIAGLERVHRSYAINIAKISAIRSNCVVINDFEIPVSRIHITRIRELLSGKKQHTN